RNQPSRIGDDDLRAPRGGIYAAVVGVTAGVLIIKGACSAPQAGLAIAEYVPGEAHSRRQVIPASFGAAVSNARISKERFSGRRQRKTLGFYTGQVVRHPELFIPVPNVDPWSGWFPTNTGVHCEPPRQLNVILNVNRRIGCAEILILAGSLVPRADVAQHKIGHCHAGNVTTENRRTTLQKFVSDLGALPIDAGSERQAVAALDPAQPVGPLEAIANERALQVVAKVANETGDAAPLNHRRIRLLIHRHAQIPPVRYSWRGAALGELPHIAEVKIVQQGGAKSVDLADVRVLHARTGAVRVAD